MWTAATDWVMQAAHNLDLYDRADGTTTVHLLQALLCLPADDIAMALILEFGVIPANLHDALEPLAAEKREKPSMAEAAMERADDVRRGFERDCLGTEHLLLGLLQCQEGLAAQLLGQFGITAEALLSNIRAFYDGPKMAQAARLQLNGLKADLGNLSMSDEEALRRVRTILHAFNAATFV